MYDEIARVLDGIEAPPPEDAPPLPVVDNGYLATTPPTPSKVVRHRLRPRPDAGRNPGEDLLPGAFLNLAIPTHPKALTGRNADWRRSGHCPDLIRDEEVVGSHPATPTAETPGDVGARRIR
ncbi:hypothetical protein ACFVWP_20885 [Streptomyces sp. NPDC058175]|uniref:hypothetical protein n=1 Tax=Streptomyces sp. NPDC058175 TaxID=3346367 RepID=UPI0036EC8558